MTPAKLQELAREAGLTIDGDSVRSPHLDCVALEDLARFAALVRAAALEEAAQACENLRDQQEDRRAHKAAAEALAQGDDDEALRRLRHHSLVNLFNGALERAAKALRSLAQQAGGEA